MGLPAGTFSSPYPGDLTITLTARFSSTKYKNAGFPSSGGLGGGTNIAIQAYGGAGGGAIGPVVDKYNLISSVTLAYPGGNAAWPVGANFVANVTDMTGIYIYTMDNIIVTCTLKKR